MFKKFTWGHGIVIALAVFMIFILSLIFIFSRGWQNAEMVSDHYYEEELNYQQVIDAKKNAQQLPALPRYIPTAAGIGVDFSALPTPPDGGKIRFELYRTDDANLDVKKELPLDAASKIQIPAKILVPGSYTLKVKWLAAQKPYQVDYDVIWK